MVTLWYGVLGGHLVLHSIEVVVNTVDFVWLYLLHRNPLFNFRECIKQSVLQSYDADVTCLEYNCRAAIAEGEIRAVSTILLYMVFMSLEPKSYSQKI